MTLGHMSLNPLRGWPDQHDNKELVVHEITIKDDILNWLLVDEDDLAEGETKNSCVDSRLRGNAGMSKLLFLNCSCALYA